MKRVISIVFALIFVLSYASAEGVTEKKNAFEFCDMYMQRLWEMKCEHGIDATHDLTHYVGYEGLSHLNVFAGSGQYYVEVPAGTLLVSIPDFFVERLDMQFVSYNESDSEKEIDLVRAAVAFAALEYDRFDDYAYSSIHKIDPSKPANVVMEAIDVFLGAVDETFGNEALMADFFSKSGNTIPFISGNYNYSLQYINGGDENSDMEFVYMIVECK